MTRSAWIGNLVLVRHLWRYEPESMGVDLHIRESGFNLRHVAGDALASGTAIFVMGVLCQGRGARTVGRRRTMAVQTDAVRGLS